MNKYEQLIEHIINDEEDKARALFHEIVVEKSRDIYESLMDEEYAEEGMGGDQVEGMIDEISMDETDGIGEGEDPEGLVLAAAGHREVELGVQVDAQVQGRTQAQWAPDLLPVLE